MFELSRWSGPWKILPELTGDDVVYEAGAVVCLIKQGRIRQAVYLIR